MESASHDLRDQRDDCPATAAAVPKTAFKTWRPHPSRVAKSIALRRGGSSNFQSLELLPPSAHRAGLAAKGAAKVPARTDCQWASRGSSQALTKHTTPCSMLIAAETQASRLTARDRRPGFPVPRLLRNNEPRAVGYANRDGKAYTVPEHNTKPPNPPATLSRYREVLPAAPEHALS